MLIITFVIPDSQTKFKISTTPSTVGVNTISIGSTPDQFDFIRRTSKQR